MTAISAEVVRKLREETGAGMMDCKSALVEAGGDMEKARELLRKKGLAAAAKKAGRATSEGLVASYIHTGGKVGVLVEVGAGNAATTQQEAFKQLVRDVTLQIAAAQPHCVSRAEVPAAVLTKEKEIAAEQFKDKPPQAVAKIVEGKLEKFYQTYCLVDQGFVKNGEISVKEHIAAMGKELGDTVTVRRFLRFQVGEALPA